jgi:phage-related protein
MFKFKGISSTDMQVIVEEEEHFLAKAAQRYEVTEIEGKDDAIFDELGYSFVERPVYIQCLNPKKIDEILAWLDGEGELEYKGRKTKARFYTELEPKRTAGIKIIDANFIRAPFWVKADDDYIGVTNNIQNVGNKPSRPVIKIEKGTSNSIELTLGGVRFKYTFSENDTYVEIDCEEKTVVYEGLNRNRNLEIGYKFPKLEVGDNSMVIHSGSATVKIKRKDRWL